MINKWTVYRCTSPSGKVYIGITSKEEDRAKNLEKDLIRHYKLQSFLQYLMLLK